MPLPVDFHFSQGSLHDFLACPRRFQLRYIDRMAWPAVEAEPYLERELHLKRGALFHRLAEQKLKGIPAEALAPLAETSGLNAWWQAFLAFEAQLPAGDRLVETALTTRLGEHRLIARYDLLIRSPDGRIHIFDWKTSGLRPKSDRLQTDIQTRLYLLMAAETSPGTRPETIDMTYWFTAFPGEPEIIPYSAAQYQRDRTDLFTLIDQIAKAPPESFILTPDEKQCRFCVYRSYCERGTGAGITSESGEDDPEGYDPDSFDFSQAAEVAF
jgi:CRISPR/Cas system-associated exonuclease Cas4 (RecB family)